jgi:hypothetical protein
LRCAEAALGARSIARRRVQKEFVRCNSVKRGDGISRVKRGGKITAIEIESIENAGGRREPSVSA